MYDTFHEPFKRVVATHPTEETPVEKDAGPSTVTEVTKAEKDSEDTSKRRKKEPELTVKSALSAAFAKYADKLGKQKSRSAGQKGYETAAENSGAENTNSSGVKETTRIGSSNI